MTEVKSLDNLVIERIETLDTSNSRSVPLRILFVGPSIKTRSSFTHVLKSLFNYFSKIPSYSTKYNLTFFSTFESLNTSESSSLIPKEITVKKGNIDDLTDTIKLIIPHVIFFVDNIEVTDAVLSYLEQKEIKQTFHVWQYFKPKAGILAKKLVEWLIKKTDRIFVPSDYYLSSLDSIKKKIDIFQIPISDDYNIISREVAEKNIEIPQSSFRWLCPDRFNQVSQVDTILSAFAKYVIKDEHKNDQLILLGNIQELDCYPVLDIFANELAILNKDINDYAANIVIINGNLASKLTDKELNNLYNSCDYVVSARNFCSHSFSYQNLAKLGLPMLLPEHSWFANTFAKEYSDGITLQPIYHAQYNTLETFGVRYLLNPNSLNEKMTELRAKCTNKRIKWSYNQDNFNQVLEKRLKILNLETTTY